MLSLGCWGGKGVLTGPAIHRSTSQEVAWSGQRFSQQNHLLGDIGGGGLLIKCFRSPLVGFWLIRGSPVSWMGRGGRSFSQMLRRSDDELGFVRSCNYPHSPSSWLNCYTAPLSCFHLTIYKYPLFKTHFCFLCVSMVVKSRGS